MTMRYLTYLQYRFSHLVAATTNNVRTAIYIYIYRWPVCRKTVPTSCFSANPMSVNHSS